jgi:hypothetical protein
MTFDGPGAVHPCPRCGGGTRVNTGILTTIACPACDGKGWIPKETPDVPPEPR